MRAPVLALAFALAAAGVAAGCSSSKSGAPETPACTLGALGAACGQGADCCSGNCQNSTCVADAGACEVNGAPCGTPSECCSGACNGACVDPSSGGCGLVGVACDSAGDCCTYACEGALGAKKCVEPAGQCGGIGAACSGDTHCCNGNCDESAGKCAVPTSATCGESGDTCSGDAECCSGVCGAGGQCTAALFCEPPGAACGSDAQCCSLNCSGGTCSSTVCRQVGEACSSGGVCCSGVCSVDSKCIALPSGSTGATCRTLGEACAAGSECCSTNCTGGTCKPAYTCNASGDVCYRSEDCCSGLCAPPAQPGQPGRCKDAPGGCALDGYPCTSDSGCCTRRCVDLGTGAKVCQPSGGCRLNGNYCDSNEACCNVNHLVDSSKWVTCHPTDSTCTNGGACNPPGDICGLGVNASQNCCFGKKDVCRYDSNGIPRCFGGPPAHCGDNGCDATCPQGWDGNDPKCCIPVGTGPESICQFRDQCCGFAPCVPGADGVLRCTAVSTCKPKGATCAGASDGSCCEGATCQNVAEIGWVCSDGSAGGCAALGGACDSDSDCCSAMCDEVNGKCVTACVPADGRCTVNGDCCSGLSCDVEPGATSGLCKGTSGGGSTCSASGQGCAMDDDCCTYGQTEGDLCLAGVCTPPSCSETGQACTAAGGGCCTGLSCWALTDYEYQVPCGDPTGVGACFCDVASGSCAPEGNDCSTIVPCCEGYCGPKLGSGACTSIDPADCMCKPIG